MKSLLTPTLQHPILSLQNSSQTSVYNATISTLHSKHSPSLQKSSGGHPTKLSETNIHHVICFIGAGRADNAVQVTKTCRDVINQPITSLHKTIKNGLKKDGLKTVVTKKTPTLTPHHKKERLDSAMRDQHWTLEDRKEGVWSDETKIKSLGFRWQEIL